MKAKRWLVDRGTMANVKKRVLALSRWTNQLWRVITCWCISKVTWSHDLNSYKVIWYKSHGLIWVCFKRWDKDVCDPYEATPWRNHTWDTNDSRSLLNYILFNLSIGIIVLSRGSIKKVGVGTKAQNPWSKTSILSLLILCESM